MKNRIFKLGESYKQTLTIEEDLVNRFAEVTGDTNPIHLDDEYAGRTFLKKRIAHGFLYGSFISRVLGTEFPGEGTIYISQSMQFFLPVYILDQLTIEIKIIELLPKNRLRLETNIINQNDELVLQGEAVVLKVTF